MGLELNYRCDECGKPRGEANHWWVLLRRAASKGKKAAIELRAMERSEAAGKGAKLFLCGQECAVKRLSAWMAEQAAPAEERVQ